MFMPILTVGSLVNSSENIQPVYQTVNQVSFETKNTEEEIKNVDKRGFWSGLWGGAKTIFGGAAWLATAGQSKDVNKFVKDSANQFYNNGSDILECTGGILGVGFGAAGMMQDGGQSFADSLSTTDWSCIHS